MRPKGYIFKYKDDLEYYYNTIAPPENSKQITIKIIMYLLIFKNFDIDDLKKLKIGKINKIIIDKMIKQFFNNSFNYKELDAIRKRKRQ